MKYILIVFITFAYSNILFSTIRHVPAEFDRIQLAIDASGNGDTVLVGLGYYTESLNFRAKRIVVASNFILSLENDDIHNTIIDGNRESVVTFNSGEDSNSILMGFTLTNGYNNQGGGIYCENSSPTLTNLIITENEYFNSGGGAYFVNSSARIKNSRISNNEVYFNDWSTSGAGLECYNSDIKIENCIIDNNEACSGAGGSYGAGIWAHSSRVMLVNVLIYDNLACESPGGGFGCGNSDVTLINVTFAGASQVGIVSQNSDLTIINTIISHVAGNFQSSLKVIDYNNSNPSNIKILHCNIQDGFDDIYVQGNPTILSLTGNISEDPKFVSLVEGNFTLNPDSPCIDAGIQDTIIVYNDGNDTVFVPSMPFKGNSRDMGAREFSESSPTYVHADHKSQNAFFLAQNYPNPFNHGTVFKFVIPVYTHTNLSVFDINGRLVENIMDRPLYPGEYIEYWPARGISTGVYYFRLNTKEITLTKKCFLLK